MTISITVTTNHGQSATVQAETMSDISEKVKGLANSLIDIHKDLNGANVGEAIVKAGDVPDLQRAKEQFLNKLANQPTKTEMQVVMENEERENTTLEIDGFEIPMKPVTAEDAHKPIERTPLPNFQTTGVEGGVPLNTNNVTTEVKTLFTPGTPAPAETDIDGIPWDERIHSSGKTRVKTGQWTKRKGLAEGVYESVLAEIRSKQAPVQNEPQIPSVNLSPAPQVQVVPPLQSEPAPSIPPLNLGNLSGPVSDAGPQLNQNLPSAPPVSAHQSGPSNVNGTSNIPVPMYDFKTFQMTLPNVLSDLFNRKLIDAQVMKELADEVKAPGDLWKVMQDQAMCNQLYSVMAYRGLIKKVG